MADLLVVENVPGEWITSAPFYKLAGIAGADNPIYATSVSDMASQIAARALAISQPNTGAFGIGVIKRLFIGGHGAPGEQSVGIGTATDNVGIKSLRVGPGGKLRGPAPAWLAALVPLLAQDVVVTLGGCEVADTVKGQNLLRAVSDALGGLAVQGATGKQFTLFGHLRGDVWRAYRGGVRNLGSWNTIPEFVIPGPRQSEVAAITGATRH